jgi:hypothetical protein
VEAGACDLVGFASSNPPEVILASLGARAPSPPKGDQDAMREVVETASAKQLGSSLASVSAHPPSPLMGDDEDLFSGADFFSSPMPPFTPLVGVGMVVKSTVL